jgi:hypothetical protein
MVCSYRLPNQRVVRAAGFNLAGGSRKIRGEQSDTAGRTNRHRRAPGTANHGLSASEPELHGVAGSIATMEVVGHLRGCTAVGLGNLFDRAVIKKDDKPILFLLDFRVLEDAYRNCIRGHCIKRAVILKIG